NDGQEVNQYGTNPKQQDTDGDTLADGAEVNDYNTSPTNPDTDGDGRPDGIEVSEGSDPLREPTVTPTPSATPTATETPTLTPTATETPTITPTPAPQTLEATSSADRHWPSRSRFLLVCLNPPCATSTPEPSLGTTPVLVLENENSSSCPQLAFCSDGLAAVQFDMVSLPAAESIQSASLILTLTDGVGANSLVEVGLATEAWNESSTGRPTCDFSNPVGANVGLTPGEYSWDVTDALITQRSNPANAYGFCLRANGDVSRTFSSRQGPANLQPRLEVVYQP
ncbi:MAG: DNRLRE domain-containing protein, partial [Candidatus Promineifilaceae bacterium]